MQCSRDLWTTALGLLKHATVQPNKSHDADNAKLSEIVVSSDGRRARLTGMDSMVEMAVDFPCEDVLEACVVPLVTLTKLTNAGKKTKGEYMTVEAIDAGLRLGIAGRTFEIARGDPERPEGFIAVDWSSSSVQSHGTIEFKAALDYCAPAATRDPTRVHMAGVYIGDDHMVATDGHRMHIAKNIDPFPGGAVILPNDTIAALRSALSKTDAPWIMARHKKKGTELVQFHVEGVLLDVLITARCVAEHYPPWQKICPQYDMSFSVDAERWTESLQTAKKLAGMEGALVSCHNECRVSIEDLFSEVLELDRAAPAKFEIKVQPKYLIEAAADSDGLLRIEFDPKEGFGPVLIRATDDHYAVVMPMR